MSSRNETLKKVARRLRRKQHIRKSVFGTAAAPRLTVARSHRNISCQVIDDERGVTLTSASTLQKDIRGSIAGPSGNKKAAAVVGKAIAERVKSLGIERVQMDRSGYRFHGCIKALVEAARSAGLKI
jgi:large subunit ribosomal protein L18